MRTRFTSTGESGTIDLKGEDLTGNILSYLMTINQIKEGSTTPLINDLEMQDVFEDEDIKEGAGITDLINQVSQLLRAELKELVNMV